MVVNKLYDLFYRTADEKNPEKLVPWIEKKLKNHSLDIDLRYLKLEILRWNNFDVADEKEEPEVMKLCTEVIKNKDMEAKITVAKAYTYRGEMRHFGIDRRKDFDKALAIMKDLKSVDEEVIFLKTFINNLYNQDFRQYLPVHFNYLNMYRLDKLP